jgi:hypothetical protein
MRRVRLFVIPVAIAVAALFGQTPPAQIPPAAPESAPAQPSPAAPPKVDAALRARVNQFYQFEVAGQFNQALQLVAKDTKDLFVGSSKPSYQSFEIQSIRYSNNFTQAQVMSLVTRLLPIQGFAGRALPTKMTSRWKLEKGKWCFYVDPQQDLPATPFGRVGPPGMALPTGGAPGIARAQPPMPAKIANPRSLVADKSTVQLKSSGPSVEQVTISNPSPWPVGLTFSDPKVAGLSVKLDTPTIKPGQKAILSIQSDGGVQVPKTPVTIVVTVPLANQTIPIQVSFAN